MKIEITLLVEEPEDVDESHPTGLTREAWDRLNEVVANAGFGWIDGPNRVRE